MFSYSSCCHRSDNYTDGYVNTCCIDPAMSQYLFYNKMLMIYIPFKDYRFHLFNQKVYGSYLIALLNIAVCTPHFTQAHTHTHTSTS